MAEVFKTEREIISHYFHLGYENGVIREFLQNYHNITLSKEAKGIVFFRTRLF